MKKLDVLFRHRLGKLSPSKDFREKVHSLCFRKLLFILLLMLSNVMALQAQTVIEYRLLEDETVQFYFPTTFNRTGDLTIPENVEINGTSYPVRHYKPFTNYAQGNPYFTSYTQSGDNKVGTLTIKAQVESLDGYFPAADHIIFPKSLKTLNAYMMDKLDNSGCTVVEVSFEDGSALESLGGFNFLAGNGMTSNLETFEFPSTIKTLGKACFYGNYKFATPALPSSLEEIGDGCFASTMSTGNNSILTIPASVKRIGKAAFQECSDIIEIIIEDGTDLVIEEGAFSGYVHNTYGTWHVETVICKSTTPFDMYAKEGSWIADYTEPTGTPTQYDWSGGVFPTYANFPKVNNEKPLLIVPSGSAATYKAHKPLDDATKTYDDIFTIVEGDRWGTIVVPTTTATMKNKGIYRIAELKSCDVQGDKSWRVVFDELPISRTTTLTRGKPYLCMPPSITVDGSYAVTPVTVSDNGYNVTFTGNLSGSSSYVPNGAYYFGSGTGKCYMNERGDEAVVLNNGRCYFTVESATSAKPTFFDIVLADQQGKKETVTRIEAVTQPDANGIDTRNPQASDAIYNLQGTRMKTASLPKGIYIQNGKKVIVK